ncbi:uncharacterized protein YunC (DUF1805 family) [Gracilibacillus halotolerans]|uniref:Uncharacterized protein YunC (DUF1805 family) n=1 Tax=Gracilibacillus halotolerans TaxID=74386 RepID=A0A841RRD7_9BACI|nr:DUF1805 domain-containing protein [Gracilibacillus halotolerans]MBB6514173.1 uncharacterized protein YunC (DUF1805 family) [Gracilibacillus halotolerans]
MMEVKPLWIENYPFTAIRVALPKTNLLVITNEIGYVMCGALDVDLLNDKLKDRGVIAGRAVGVKTLDDLLHAKLNKVTLEAQKKYGWREGMDIKEALVALGSAEDELLH